MENISKSHAKATRRAVSGVGKNYFVNGGSQALKSFRSERPGGLKVPVTVTALVMVAATGRVEKF